LLDGYQVAKHELLPKDESPDSELKT
jgi:hypothetical protein